MLIIGIVFAGLFLAKNTRAASVNCYWVGDTNPANWNDAAHWSSSDGGGGGTCDGGVVPGSDDTVYFTSSNSNDLTVDVAVDVRGINIGSGYGGTITQGTGLSITVGSSGITQAGGTFTGSNADITNSGSFTLSGGTFNSTSAVFQMWNFVHSSASGVFNEGTGSVRLKNDVDVNSSETFYNLEFDCGYDLVCVIYSADTLTVDGTLTLTSGGLDKDYWGTTGVINAKGNINQSSGFNVAPFYGSAFLHFANDSVSQTYTISGGNAPYLYFDAVADASDSVVLNADATFWGINIGGTFAGDVPINYNSHNITTAQYFIQSAGNFTAPATMTTSATFTKSGGNFIEGTYNIVAVIIEWNIA